MENNRIGIFGGTFNPIHNGHLIISMISLIRLKLDKVIFVPNNIPTYKDQKYIAANEHRYNMIKLALEKYNNVFEVSDFEISREEISYTINAIKEFRKTYERDQLYFLLGSDSMLEIHTWERYEELLKLCNFAVIIRPGFSKNKVAGELSKHGLHIDKDYTILDMISGSDISSTNIREQVKKGIAIENLTQKNVIEYIEKNNLYKDES